MTKVSRQQSNSKQSESNLKDLWSAITLLKNREETKGFLSELLSHTEMMMLAKRVQIVRGLLKDESYRVIKQRVVVQNSTIAKINNQLHTSREGWLARLTKRLIDTEAPTKGQREKKKETAAGPALPFTFGAPRE